MDHLCFCGSHTKMIYDITVVVDILRFISGQLFYAQMDPKEKEGSLKSCINRNTSNWFLSSAVLC